MVYKHAVVAAFRIYAQCGEMLLKFGTKLDSDKLYCVTKNQPHIAYQSLYLFIFLSLRWKFLSQISLHLLEPVFSNFVYTFR